AYHQCHWALGIDEPGGNVGPDRGLDQAACRFALSGASSDLSLSAGAEFKNGAANAGGAPVKPSKRAESGKLELVLPQRTSRKRYTSIFGAIMNLRSN